MDDLHAIRVALEQITYELSRLRAATVEPRTSPVAYGSHQETDMLDAKAVAALLAMHTNWVYAEAKEGRLPSYKIGGSRRFRRSEIDDYLARHCRQPSSND